MNLTQWFKYPVWIHLAVIFVLIGCGQSEALKIHPVAARQAHTLIEKNAGNPDFIVLDIRTPKEFNQGHITGALLLDYYHKGFITGLQKLDKSKTYLIYCRTGNRSGRTMKMINNMGFSTVYHLNRGIVEWVAHKLPLVKK